MKQTVITNIRLVNGELYVKTAELSLEYDSLRDTEGVPSLDISDESDWKAVYEDGINNSWLG